MPDQHQSQSAIDVADLPEMDRRALLAAWRGLFPEPPPKGLSAPFLRRFLAFELQARRHGGLPKSYQRALKTAAAPKTRPARSLKPGGRLLREWNGVTHTVDVTDDAFIWRGECYRSLSAIARAITGVRWSGPRFFGLKDTE